ncbi:MAG: hypothetical protein JW860_09605 [Sedimentisphaerales bacterium]|nr:hypothetical protein [Sedimentisphaerales bacterium]
MDRSVSEKDSKKSHGYCLDKWRRPRNREQLAAYVREFLGISVPDRNLCPEHQSPLDYLAYSFLGDASEAHTRDIVVWANRGGGKTQLGAVASLLEGVFLPKCKIRILAGSQEQSQRMYEYLRDAAEQRFPEQVKGRPTSNGFQFKYGGDVKVLAQSDRSVRGHHVQRIRCDELELFKPEIWRASQFVTHSKDDIPARLEGLSTMHRPFGLMQEVINTTPKNRFRVFHWCLWEVIEPCRDRVCGRCQLNDDCRGIAKKGVGYFSIDDAIAQKSRSSLQAWRAEMLCQQPNLEDQVFGEFDPRVHVRKIGYNPNLPLYRSIDFGFSNPTACLFIQVNKAINEVYIIDEHVQNKIALDEQARIIQEKVPYPVAATYCDPAGNQRSIITGTAVTYEMATLGIPCRTRHSKILDGVEKIRSFLKPASGHPRLFIAPKCQNLIRAFQCLHFKRQNGILQESPEKDGVHDHVIDALRYFFINHFQYNSKINEKGY